MNCTNEDCRNYNSCKMLTERFGVQECEPFRRLKVAEGHKKELEAREKLLKELEK